MGKVDREKDKIKGAKNQKNVKGAKKTTKVSQKDLVRMCKRKAEAQFRKCAKGSRGGNAGGNFLAHTGCKKQRKKDMLACESPRWRCSSGYGPVHILECCMWFASIKVETETKRDDSIELSRSFVFGEVWKERGKWEN